MICLYIYGYKSVYLHAAFFISLFSICFVDIDLSIIFIKKKLAETFGIAFSSKPYFIMFAKMYRTKYSNYPIF